MQKTRLIITIYDADNEDQDDFMGEVVIELNKILPILLQGATQNTYPLKPQVTYDMF